MLGETGYLVMNIETGPVLFTPDDLSWVEAYRPEDQD